MTFVSIPVAFDAHLAKDFAVGNKKLQPVVFSHGEAADRMLYSGILRELASYGFLVVALNHNDQTCMHTMGLPVDEKEKSPAQINGNSDGPIAIDTTEKNEEKSKEQPKEKKRKQLKFDKSISANSLQYTRL